MKFRMRLLGAAAVALCSGHALAADGPGAALQPSLNLEYRFGARTVAPALQLGAQLAFSDRALAGLAAGLDAQSDSTAQLAAQLALRAALPPLLALELRSDRSFTAQLVGAELAARMPVMLNADGAEAGGWRWSKGTTWIVAGLAATAALVSVGGSGDEETVNNGIDPRSGGCNGVGTDSNGDVIVAGPDCGLPGQGG